MVRKRSFRQSGVPHTLIVLSDVSRALREEERSAWQRLIRVLGHELNNSLAPIMSIAGSLAARLPQLDLPGETKSDFQRGLDIIESRTAVAASLPAVLSPARDDAFAEIATVELRPLAERVAVLETRLPVRIAEGPDIALMIDPDLIEQMLINLVRNAVDSALEQAHTAAGTEPEVTLRWEQDDSSISLVVEDNGIGLLNPSNAFVPFYTTKQGGSGIGLVLSQQIAEAHGGSIELANRKDTRGCIVTVQLPHRELVVAPHRLPYFFQSADESVNFVIAEQRELPLLQFAERLFQLVEQLQSARGRKGRHHAAVVVVAARASAVRGAPCASAVALRRARR